MNNKNLSKFYSNQTIPKDQYSLAEEKMLNILLKTQEWNNLDEEGKKVSREKRVHWLESKIYVNSHLPKFVEYEKAVIDLYSTIDIVISKIENVLLELFSEKNLEKTEILIIRLYTVLVFEKESINTFYNLEKVSHVPEVIIENLLDDLIDFNDEYLISKIRSLHKKVIDLHNQKPYDKGMSSINKPV